MTKRGWVAAACLVGAWCAATDAQAVDPPDESGKDVVVATSDGMKLAATWWDVPEAGVPGAVLLHMEKSDRNAWASAAATLRSHGMEVLAIDLRGHGESAKQAKGDLAPRAARGDPKLWAEMVQDAIAGVRHLVREGKCGPKRVAVVGAGPAAAVALETLRKFPNEVAAAVCLTPGAAAPGPDAVAAAKAIAPEKPVLVLAHQTEADAGARAICEARPAARLLVYEESRPAAASGDGDAWARGTRMLGRLPLVEATIASFVAMATGSKKDDVLLDGVVDAESAAGGPWTRAGQVAKGPEVEAWAYRIGRRVTFGGRVKGKAAGLFVGLATHYVEGTAPGMTSDPASGFPETAAIDLAQSRFAWVAPMDSAKSGGAKAFAHRVRPAVRVVKTADGFSFEGEWITDYGDGAKGPVDPEKVRLAFEARAAVPETPRVFAPGAVAMEIAWQDAAVAVPSR